MQKKIISGMYKLSLVCGVNYESKCKFVQGHVWILLYTPRVYMRFQLSGSLHLMVHKELIRVIKFADDDNNVDRDFL